jgi:uncharacterized protein (DUF2461 family)
VRQANELDHSLRLVKLKALQLAVLVTGEDNNPRLRVQARFTHNRNDYHLWVTDPTYENRYLQRGNGVYDLGECFVTVSIGEPMGDYCFKLVAAIIEPPDRGN